MTPTPASVRKAREIVLTWCKVVCEGQNMPELVTAIAAALDAADRVITAQDKLLVAYRLGSSQRAGKAIDELESARKAYDATTNGKL